MFFNLAISAPPRAPPGSAVVPFRKRLCSRAVHAAASAAMRPASRLGKKPQSEPKQKIAKCYGSRVDLCRPGTEMAAVVTMVMAISITDSTTTRHHCGGHGPTRPWSDPVANPSGGVREIRRLSFQAWVKVKEAVNEDIWRILFWMTPGAEQMYRKTLSNGKSNKTRLVDFAERWSLLIVVSMSV